MYPPTVPFLSVRMLSPAVSSLWGFVLEGGCVLCEFQGQVCQTPRQKLHPLLRVSLGSHTEPSLSVEESQAPSVTGKVHNPHHLMGRASKNVGAMRHTGIEKHDKVSDLELGCMSFESKVQDLSLLLKWEAKVFKENILWNVFQQPTLRSMT